MQELVTARSLIMEAGLRLVDEEEPPGRPLRWSQRHVGIVVWLGFLGEKYWQILVQFRLTSRLLPAGEHGERNDRQALNFSYSKLSLAFGRECPVRRRFCNFPEGEFGQQTFIQLSPP
jgi:hypothetical protein